jgi:hypothetical protein
MRAYNSTYARDQLNQHFTKKTSEQVERQRRIAEENDHLNRLRQQQEQDKLNQRRTREARRQEMTSTLTHLDQSKRQQWEEKKNDQTNKIMTEQLQNEISQLTQQSIQDQWRQKSEYNKDLSQLTAAQRQALEQDRQRAREEEARAKGLTFECYTRDPAMKEATKETGKYQATQKELEAQRKIQEKQSLIQPPPSLVTTEELTKMQQEALNQDFQKRLGLKEVMQAQYHETQAQRNARIAEERRRDAEEAARVAARNAELTKMERDIAETTKKNYGEYLGYQLTDAQRRKMMEEADRKYDPNTERLIQENSRIGEKIVKCGKCCSTLAHERTVLEDSSNGHTH